MLGESAQQRSLTLGIEGSAFRGYVCPNCKPVVRHQPLDYRYGHRAVPQSRTATADQPEGRRAPQSGGPERSAGWGYAPHFHSISIRFDLATKTVAMTAKMQEAGGGDGGEAGRDLRDHGLQALDIPERLHGAGADAAGGGGEQRHVEPVALLVVLGLEDAERAVVVRVLVDVERDEGDDAGDGARRRRRCWWRRPSSRRASSARGRRRWRRRVPSAT